MACKSSVCLWIGGILGVAMIVSGCFLLQYQSQIVDNAVKEGVKISPDSSSFDNWKAPKSPVYFQAWIFDVVNHQEVLQGGKPSLVQRGPYTYREQMEKFNISFNENGTVNYRESKTYYFVPEMSAGTENDTFSLLSIPMITVMTKLKDQNFLVKAAINLALELSGETLFSNLTVSQILWGYPDPFFAAVKKELDKLPFRLPIKIPVEFGLFLGSNGTDDGVYEVFTGTDDVDSVGKIVTWNAQESLTYWTSNISNGINGSDGTTYAPFFEKNETKYLFSTSLCRSLGLDFSESISHRGISMYRYIAPQSLFVNASVNPDNEGFCTPKDNCLPSGLLNVANCRQGAPIVLSNPHFLGCDEDIIHSVSGLHPNLKEHQSFIDIEKMTGVVMSAGKKVQINAHVIPISDFGVTEKLRDVFLPVVWFNESALIDQHDADSFKSSVYGKVNLLSGTKYSLIGVGAFLVILVIAVMAVRTIRRRNYERLQGTEVNSVIT